MPIEEQFTSARYEGLKNPVIIFGEPNDSFEFRAVDETQADCYKFKCKVTIKYRPKPFDVNLYQNPFSSHAISPVIKDMSNLLDSGKYSDFKIKVGQKEFNVHKCMLSQASPFFETMFDCGLDESKNSFVELKDQDEDVVQFLLDFIYKGKLPENMDEIAFDLFALAHQYEIDSLKTCCLGHICMVEITEDNSTELQKFATQYGIEELQERLSETKFFGTNSDL